MKKKLTILTLMVLVGALLTACSVSEPALNHNQGISVPEGTISIEAVEGTDVPGDKVSSENSEVSWTEALELLNNGDVKLVSQSHNLEVSLVLNDGRTVTTVEPSIDAIFKAIAECGEVCSNVVLVTE